ncbi:Sulfhydrylase-like protein lolC2 like [Verticillium longisporum]|uniref:Sulfhydrylase-like protein lolC2 like n=1 Tax=Verticillium longisporum TaxID=100787 RepID=A0A8I3AKZ0_VERLO|nr:Sulfhydrylase-like protein lolC2 like [Verticillium longisporum]
MISRLEGDVDSRGSDTDQSSTSSDATWHLHYDTAVIHAGLDKTPRHGECTVPVFNSASFKFPSSAAADDAFSAVPDVQRWVYSRFGNVCYAFLTISFPAYKEQPTNDAFERRMVALEDGVDAVSLASGAAATLTVAMSLARVGDNVIVSNFTHGGTFHQFKLIMAQMGVESRFCNTNDLERVRSLLDERTKFIFTETIGNPKFSVADLEPLAEIAHGAQIPLVVDATFTAAGYFCQPARWGADIIIHSATKWIGGHGTTLGGVVIETGRSDWQSNVARFPQLHGREFGSDKVVGTNLYTALGSRAYMQMLKWDFMRDTGACLAAPSAQQLCIGLETLPLRCERQTNNADQLARWLRAHSRVAWVRYLGFEDQPDHALAKKYFTPGHGFGSVLTFGLKGGAAEGFALIDAFKLITNTPNVGDAKTIIGHHWSTTHKQCSPEEMENMGVYEDLLRLSLGIEHISDIVRDFEQALDQTSHLVAKQDGAPLGSL